MEGKYLYRVRVSAVLGFLLSITLFEGNFFAFCILLFDDVWGKDVERVDEGREGQEEEMS